LFFEKKKEKNFQTRTSKKLKINIGECSVFASAQIKAFNQTHSFEKRRRKKA
jgi:hypothetical protein